MIIPVMGRGGTSIHLYGFGNQTHQRSLFLYNFLNSKKDNITEISVKLLDCYKMSQSSTFIVSIFPLVIKKKNRNVLVNGCIVHMITELLDRLQKQFLIYRSSVHYHISILLFICVIFI